MPEEHESQAELDRLTEIIERIHQQASRVKDAQLYPSIKHATEVERLLEMIDEMEA